MFFNDIFLKLFIQSLLQQPKIGIGSSAIETESQSKEKNSKNMVIYNIIRINLYLVAFWDFSFYSNFKLKFCSGNASGITSIQNMCTKKFKY